ncbi:MAG: BRCT domain-containing protein [Sulfitobacter sp.]|nr:BRCT domain-containing protein [Sulfitobacter sp.]
MEPINYESKALHSIHAESNDKKNDCYFVGFLDGILANKRLDETELEPLLAECDAFCRQVGDEDAAEILQEAAAGHKNTVFELFNVLQNVVEVRLESIDPACKRSSANRLLGFCAGVNCDAIITKNEAYMLYEKLSESHELEDDPRIAALKLRLYDALADGVIDPDESDEIGDLITTLVGDSYSHTGVASSEAIPIICDIAQVDEADLLQKNVVLTGAFNFGTRASVTERLEEIGATVQASPSKKTDIVILGSNGSAHYTYKQHGGKLAKALKLRETASAPAIYTEGQLRTVFQ